MKLTDLRSQSRALIEEAATALGMTKEEVLRRANLAGAAQELYVALQEAIAWWDGGRVFVHKPGEDPIKPWRDAIAKAEGR